MIAVDHQAEVLKRLCPAGSNKVLEQGKIVQRGSWNELSLCLSGLRHVDFSTGAVMETGDAKVVLAQARRSRNDASWNRRLKLYPVRPCLQSAGRELSCAEAVADLQGVKSKPSKRPADTHRIPESEIDRLKLPAIPQRGPVQKRRETFRTISGRNQLVGRVVELKIEGLMAQVTLSIAGQRLTSIITADAVREMRLEKGQIAAALVKSTDVMVMRAK